MKTDCFKDNLVLGGLLLALAVLAPGAARADDWPLDLSHAANMGFRDEVAGDGKGGWSDQGPGADMDGFDVARTDYAGIRFAVLDPAKNGGRAVVTFDNEHVRTGVTEATVELPAPRADARFLYLLHTTCWNNEKLGDLVGGIEVAFDDGTKARKDVRSGVDVSDWWNASSGLNSQVAVRKASGDVRLGVYLSKFALPSGKNVRSVTFRSNGKAVWIVVGATLSSRDVALGDPGVAYVAGREWKPVDLSDLDIAEGSALDLSSLVEPGPAGRHGRAVVGDGGGLAFADSPGVPRRFIGFNGLFYTTLPDDRQARVARIARLIRRQGYNVVRLLVMEHYIMLGAQADCEIVPAKIDEVDFLMAQLKANGIYVIPILSADRMGFKEAPWGLPAAADYRARMYIGEPKMRENWQTMAGKMLGHVNPYTGVAWKDEPAILGWDIYNEQEWGMNSLNRLSPATRALFDDKWHAWLLRKYQNADGLAAAWGDDALRKPGAVDKLTIPNGVGSFGENANVVNGASDPAPVANDFGLFFRDLAREEVDWCRKTIRDAGYPGLFAAFDISKEMLDSRVRWELSPLVNIHSYYSHPSAPRDEPGSRLPTVGSSAGNAAADYWRDACSTRLWGRPLLVTEFNHAFWNKYKREAGLLFSAYSAFQDFSGLTIFHDPVYPASDGSSWVAGNLRNFNLASSPVGRAGEFLSSLLFLRGDVRKAPHRIEVSIPDSYLNADANGNLAVNTEETKLSLLTGFGLGFPGAPALGGAGKAKAPAAPDLILPPAKGARVIGVLLAAANTSASGAGEFPLRQTVADLKEKGILPASNLTDPGRGIFQSETGEITMRTRENLIKVVTPRSEGVSLEAGASEELGALKVEGSSVPACVAACAMDGSDLKGSGRIVLVYSTEAANSGMELSEDGFTLRKLGGLPVLLRCGQVHLTLKNAQAGKLSLYALGLNGARKEKLPLAAGNGALDIRIDTAALKDGPTPFFELAAE